MKSIVDKLRGMSAADLALIDNLLTRLGVAKTENHSETELAQKIVDQEIVPDRQIANSYLEDEDETVKSAYFSMLGLFAIQRSQAEQAEGMELFSRLVAGAQTELSAGEYLKRAYKMSQSGLADNVQILSEDVLRYRLFVDALVVLGRARTEKSCQELAAGICELLQIEVDEAAFLCKLADSILRRDNSAFLQTVCDNITLVPDAIANDYFELGEREQEELYEKASQLFRSFHPQEAIPLLEKLVSAGDSRVYAMLYWIYYDGFFRDGKDCKDENKANQYLAAGYEADDAVATLMYALFCNGCDKDLANRILPEVRDLAERGDVLAEYALGVVSLNDIGQGIDFYQAVKHFVASMQPCFARAARGVFLRYKNGDGLYRKNWLELSAWAQAVLGYQNLTEERFSFTYLFDIAYAYMNIEDYGCTDANIQQQFYRQAFELFDFLSAHGHIVAPTNLGWMCENGRGTTQDNSRAFRYYALAAERGDNVGQCNLAFCYENGRGCSVDMDKALSWYKKSAAQGWQRAIDAVNRIEKNNSVSEPTDSDELANALAGLMLAPLLGSLKSLTKH